MKYRPAIDGLRAVAVLSVFIFHLNHHWLPGGFMGVDVFFVISGYLITSIIYGECEAGNFSLPRFYQRRIARIFPAFFTVALATLAGAYFTYSPQDLASSGANLGAAALSVANMKLMFQGNYFEISPDAQPFLHYWSLSVEEQFYIFYPFLFLLIFRYARRHQILLLGTLGAASFLACLVMTAVKPDWAFYLLPTRAWELVAGCLLAILVHDPVAWSQSCRTGRLARVQGIAAALGLVALGLSFILVHEGPPSSPWLNRWPGPWALIPVAGAVCVLMPPDKTSGQLCRWQNAGEKLLAAAPLVLLGRMSYSLYLWHWPVFSLVDYRMYFVPEHVRLAIKIGLSLILATLSFWLIENPARSFLNRPQSKPVAYLSLVCAVAVCVPLGFAVRSANYVNVESSDVAKGGLLFNAASKGSAVILMGDSNGSMYGKVTREICSGLGWKLRVISVAAGDPLPTSRGPQSPLWLDSLAIVKDEKPDCLVLACCWEARLKDDRQRLAIALEALKPYVGRLVILNQPPILPRDANRAAIRDGQRPPFYENSETRRSRLESNDFLNRFISRDCEVVDIASFFQKNDLEVRFLDEAGHQLYHDALHLSGYGADLIRPILEQAITGRVDTAVQRGSPSLTDPGNRLKSEKAASISWSRTRSVPKPFTEPQ